MAPPTHSRRSILRSGGSLAGVLAAGSLAGCLDGRGGPEGTEEADGTPDDTGTDRLGFVPPAADVVATADANALLGDDGVRAAADAFLQARAQSPVYDGPENLAATLQDFEQREGFDLRDLSAVTMFYDLAAGEETDDVFGSAVVLEGSWNWSAALATVETDGIDYTESTYGGYTTYEPDEGYGSIVGVLADGRYAVGTRAAVRATIDVARGETAPIDGPVAAAYGDTAVGPVSFASTVEEAWIPPEVGSGAGTVDLSAARAIRTAAGAIYREGDVRGLETRLATPDATTATDLEELLGTLRSVALSRSDGSTIRPVLAGALEDATIGRDGATVTVTVERTVAELEEMATTLGEAPSAPSGPRAPAVSFEWEFDADAGTVTITHTAGDTVAADELAVQGEGFVDAPEADMTAAGEWAGTSGDDGSVAAGDSVVVGARADCSLRVIWSGENVAATLDQFEGPEA